MPTETILERLLSSGYLPEVLPPCFSGKSFAEALNDPRFSPAFNSKKNVPKASKCVRYLEARPSGATRVFSIPNPVHYYRLCNYASDNWQTLIDAASTSKVSITKPIASNGKRCIRPNVDYNQRPAKRAHVRATARFLLRADISRFFPTIYTHSIPWAMEGKTTAKAFKNAPSIGNSLDTMFRAMQDNQTMGIPIGQDISRLIAEVILAKVEADIGWRRPITGMRCIDDYEIGFMHERDAKEFLHKLQKALAHYELSLNPLKTSIVALPQLLFDRWDSELRRFELGDRDALSEDVGDEDDGTLNHHGRRNAQVANNDSLLTYFNKAIELQSHHKEDAVIRFALKRLAPLRMTIDCWPLYQDFLLHCALNRPDAMRVVTSNLLKAVHLDNMTLDHTRLGLVINAVVESGSGVGRSSDVAWALWTALLFRIPISRLAARSLSECEDSVVACLSQELRRIRLIGTRFVPEWCNKLLQSEDAFYGEHWLFAYEAARNGWCSTVGPKDPCFRLLLERDVSFFLKGHASAVRKDLRSRVDSDLITRRRSTNDESENSTSDSEDGFDQWWQRED